MESKYIKFGDVYLEVTEKDGKLNVNTITDAQKMSDISMEKVMLMSEDPDESSLQKVFESAEKELLESLKKGLKDTVLKIMGFDNSWGRGWEVKSNDNTQAARLISVKLESILKDVKEEDIMPTKKEKEQILKDLRKTILSRYTEQMNRNVWKVVEDMVVHDCRSIADDLIKERTKAIAEKVFDNFTTSTKKPR